jgi:Domain of unknown function (DUF6265)
MYSRTWPATTLVLFATLGAALASFATNALSAQTAELIALDGEWIYVEDRTEGRALERLGPPMSSKFSLRIEDGAVILVHGHGGGRRNVRIVLDGSITEVSDTATGEVARYRGTWKEGAFTYEIDFVRAPGKVPEGLIRREFRVTPDGLLVRFSDSVGLYRHAQDIALPAPAKAAIGDLAWLAGAWVGTSGAEGATSIEERWSPPLGGAMLAVSRTVSRGKMRAFEFLRIVERDDGLVYIAQPGGAPPTEFVLTEMDGTRAVFDNPRHDYPKRIVYELSAKGDLSATIGFTKGGSPRRFEYKREAPGK